MFTGARPSRLRQLSVTVALVATLSVAATLLLVSLGAPGSFEHRSLTPAEASPASQLSATPSRNSAFSSPRNQVEIVGAGSETFGVVATVAVQHGSFPVGVAVDAARHAVYVTNAHADRVSVIDDFTQTVAITIPVGLNPAGVVFDSVNDEVYVSNFLGNTVSVINTTSNTVVDTIPVPGGPGDMACDSLNGNIYVTAESTNVTSVIGATNNTVFAHVAGGYPEAAAFDPTSGDVYVANAGWANVSVISSVTNSLIGSIPVGSEPLGVAYNSGNGDIYVSNFQSDNVSVISGLSVVTSVPVGSAPVGVAYNPTFSVVAVVADGSGQVNFISNATNGRVGNVSVGDNPIGIAYDGSNGYDYVANANSSNVSVIGTALLPPYAVTFGETGLSTGTNWSVTLAGSLENSTTSTIVFSELNGSFSYTVTPIAGYVVSPVSGSVVVDGFPVPIAITFTQVLYNVTFHETGLESGTAWSVTFAGLLATSTTANLTFTFPNGTYDYNVTAVTNFSASPTPGTVTVNGAQQTVPITFSSTSSPPPLMSASSGSLLWLYALIAVVVAAVVIVLVLIVRRRPPPAGAPLPAPSPAGPGTRP